MHWKDMEDAQVPRVDDSWDRPSYDELAALSPVDLLRVAWNIYRAYGDLSMEALNLAQDLSCEFEMCDYRYVKDDYRHEESLNRQDRGMGYMRHAYAMAGFTDERRDAIKGMASQIVKAKGWGV